MSSTTVRPLKYHIATILINISIDKLISTPSTPYLAPVPLPFVPDLEWLCINGSYYSTPFGLQVWNYIELDTYVDPEVYISLAVDSFLVF